MHSSPIATCASATNAARRKRATSTGRIRSTTSPRRPRHRRCSPRPIARIDAEARACVCPAGKSLYRRDGNRKTKDDVGAHFRGAKRDCGLCPLRAQCLRTPDTTLARNIAFFRGRIDVDRHTHTARMQARIDTPAGREAYGQRFATVEPVFGNLRANKRLDRFTLRGRAKVHGQWTLSCLVHNIEKLAHAAYAA